MKIVHLSPELIPQWEEFNQKVYPLRKKHKKLLEIKIINHPYISHDSSWPVLIAITGNNQFVGQIALIPTRGYLYGEKINAYFGNDLYVEETVRSTGAGAILLMKAMQQYQPYFAIGVSEVAYKLSLALKARYLGGLVKYLWVNYSPGSFLNTVAFRKRYHFKTNYPNVIQVNKQKIFRIKNIENLKEELDNYFHDIPLFFSREKKFLQWRFGSLAQHYGIYSLNKGRGYFVVRYSMWKNLPALFLIDYRLPINEQALWNTMMNGVKRIAKNMRLAVVLTKSSHRTIDEIFEKSGFKRIGKEDVILGYGNFKIDDHVVKKRQFVLATWADSDGEINLLNL
ncbi:hypothetical protein [Lutibacter sp.]